MRRALAIVVAVGAVVSAQAEDVSLKGMQCTILDDGRSASAETLLKEGFEIVAKDRFNNVNLVMANHKGVHANCIRREGDK